MDDVNEFIETLPYQNISYHDVLSAYGANSLSKESIEKGEYLPQKVDRSMKSGRRTPVPWTEQELETFINGIKKYGAGNWAMIRKEHQTMYDVNDRMLRDLSKKWEYLRISDRYKYLTKYQRYSYSKQ